MKNLVMKILASLSLISIFGVIGGVEFDSISLFGGIGRITILFIIFIVTSSQIEIRG